MDRRIQKTKAGIRGAYFSLLREDPKGRITVAELTRRANIDRKTFYLHYSCLDEIVEEFGDETVNALLERLAEARKGENPVSVQTFFRILSELLAENMDCYRLLSLGSHPFFWERIQSVLVDILLSAYAGQFRLPAETVRLYCDFFISGMIHLYRDCLTKPERITPAQMEQVIVDIAAGGLTGLVEKGPLE